MKENNMSKQELLNPQGVLVCPVCGKEFKANDDTKYIAAGGYTCSWKCFLNETKRKSEEKKEQKNARCMNV